MRGKPGSTYGTLDAIAHAAVYLAGDEAGFVHGMVINVDGGRVGVGRRYSACIAEHPDTGCLETRGDQQMSATLKLTHKAIGAEVRRDPYHVVVDGERVGSVEMNDTVDIPVEPGRHTLQVRDGRKSSGTETFDVAEGGIVAFRCTGKRFLPIFLASFIFPRLALKLVRD
jgi:hypothetical protein